MFKKARIYLIICLLALFQYGNTFEHDYAWDDAIVITQNERVQQGLSNPADFFRNIKGDEVQYRYGYRPISLLSFALDIELSGMTPKTGHVMNVIYYALLCCLIFYFLRRMFPEKSAPFAIIIVGLFLIHPVHTEVVANIKSRDEILAMIFGMLSLLFFLNFLEKPKRNILYGLCTILALVFSFLSKENGIIFVPILFIVAYFKQSERIKPYFKFSVLVLGVIVLLGIRFYVYSDGFFENNATALLESSQYKEDGFLGNPLFDAKGFKEIIPNVLSISMKYLGLMVLPYTLVHDYGFSHSTIVSWGNPLVILAVIFHLGLIYVLVREFKKKSVLLFGILFYFLSLSIYLHIVQIGPDYMGERFLFIPSLGFFIALVALIERLTKASFNSDAEPIWKNGKAKFAFGALALFFMMGFVKTLNRNKAWENNMTLYEADIKVLYDCARTQYNYACLLHQDYYANPSPEKAERVLYHYERAVAISDRSMKPMLDLGNAYMEFGRFSEGRQAFERAVKVHNRVATPLMQLGKYYLSQNEFDKALREYEKAGKLSSIPEVNQSKAICLLKMNKLDAAISTLEEGEKLNPTDPAYFVLLSDLYASKKLKYKAIMSIREAERLAPEDENIKQKIAQLNQ